MSGGPNEIFGREATYSCDDFVCGLCGKQYELTEDFVIESGDLTNYDDPAHFYYDFGGKCIGQCCFHRFERLMLTELPEVVAWYTKYLEAVGQRNDRDLRIVDGHAPEVPLGLVMEVDFPELFMELLGRSRVTSDEKCEWCDQTSFGNDDEGPGTCMFLGRMIVECCWAPIQRAFIDNFPVILPWWKQMLFQERQTIKTRQAAVADVLATQAG